MTDAGDGKDKPMEYVFAAVLLPVLVILYVLFSPRRKERRDDRPFPFFGE